MGLKPRFKIEANGSDISRVVNSRLVDMELKDEAGYRSDEFNLTLSDHDPRNPIDLPPDGAELTVWLGYDDVLTRMGVFVVDEIELSGPPYVMKIKAKASPQTAASRSGQVALQSQRTRSWEAGTTLGDMTRTIAGEHGLRAAVDAQLDAVVLPHVDQIDESDINLLTRLSRDYDGVAKPAGGSLVLVRRGSGQTASGEEIPTVQLRPWDITQVKVNRNGRAAGSAVAIWRDTAGAVDREVTAGEGEPVRRLRHRYTDEASAEAAARAELSRQARGEQKGSVTLPGDPDLQAEGKVELISFRDGIDGEWLVTSATHKLSPSNGYVTTLELEAFGPGSWPSRGLGQRARSHSDCR